MGPFQISVVLCTCNRASQLSLALDALLAQAHAPAHDVIVVDNDSTDETAAVVQARLSAHPHLRYVFEPVRGLPHARNAGIASSTAPIVAFTDDDIVVASDWVASIERAFERHPEADCVGGRVLPRWPPAGVPKWFSRLQLAPLALQDKGDRPMAVGKENAAPCLIGANCAFRRRAFDKAGLFSPDYTRTQDREIQLRLWTAGGAGMYVPDIVSHVDVPADRLTKAYYRHWYGRAGMYHSRMGLLDVIGADGRLVVPPRPERCLLGVPPYVYRQLAAAVCGGLHAALRRDERTAFYHENRVRYLGSYIAERWRRRERVGARQGLRDLANLVRRRLSPAERHASIAPLPGEPPGLIQE